MPGTNTAPIRQFGGGWFLRDVRCSLMWVHATVEIVHSFHKFTLLQRAALYKLDSIPVALTGPIIARAVPLSASQTLAKFIITASASARRTGQLHWKRQ